MRLAGAWRDRRALALVLLLAVTLAGRLAVALAHHTSLIAKEIYKDDAFYYFTIARNVVAGRGFTVDGVEVTAGFQPLFQLLLIGLAGLMPDRPIALLHAAGVLNALVATATGLVLFLLARRLGGGAFLTLALWAISPYFITHDVNGQETALAVFFSVTLVLLHLAWIRGAEDVPRARSVGLGVVVGLGVLARVDFLLLLAAMLVDGARRAPHFGKYSRAVGVALASAFLVWLPWGAYSALRLGHALPSSGDASRVIALELGWGSLPRIWSAADADARSTQDPFIDRDDPPLAFHADLATRLAFVGAHEFPPLAPLRFDQVFHTHPQLGGYRPYSAFVRSPRLGLVALVGALAALLVFARRQRSAAAARNAPGLGGLLGLHGALLFLGYTLHSPAHWNFNRYLVVFLLLGTAAFVASAVRVLLGPGAPRSRRLAAAGLAIVLLGCQVNQLRYFHDLSWRPVPPQGFLRAWVEIEPRVPKGTLGAFQSGVIGYFSARDVVNLDGKVNEGAAEALRLRRTDDYVVARGIDFVMDWDPILNALYARQLSPDAKRLRRVPIDAQTAGVSLYRVLPRNDE